MKVSHLSSLFEICSLAYDLSMLGGIDLVDRFHSLLEERSYILSYASWIDFSQCSVNLPDDLFSSACGVNV